MLSTTNHGVDLCVQEAIATAASNRRPKQRYPFFRPITIMTGADKETTLPAFSRDISPGGIGLLHAEALEAGPAVLSIPRKEGHPLEISVEVEWCECAGAGWYISGGRIVKLSAGAVTSLLLAVIKGEASRRLQQRHPFFRPIRITMGGRDRPELSAFSRDISPAGIGLLHSMPLDVGRVILNIPSTQGYEVDVSTEIKWCSPVGQGWYVSGGKFTTLLLEEVPSRRL